MFFSKHLKKSIVVLVLILFVFSVPKKSEAVWPVIDPTHIALTTKTIIKDYVLDQIAWNLSQQVLNKMTAQTVNWINSGFKGKPMFVENPDQFFLKIGDNVASKILTETTINVGGTNIGNLCQPFKAQVTLALRANYLQDTDPQYSCTLGTLANNYENFINDFSQGGWDGWFKVTQNNSNNPMGAYLETEQQLRLQIASQQKQYEQKLNWGKGLLSQEVCPEGKRNKDVYPAFALSDPNSPVKTGFEPEGCSVTPNVVTPGSIIQDQLAKSLNVGRDKLVVADSINEIINALMNQLIAQVAGGIGKGLRGLSEKGSTEETRVSPFTAQLGSETLSPDLRAESIKNRNNLIASISEELKDPRIPEPDQPFMFMNPTNPIEIEVGSEYKEPGAQAFDINEGDLSSRIVMKGQVDTDTEGNYIVSYNVTNSKGIAAYQLRRTVKVVPKQDTTPANLPNLTP